MESKKDFVILPDITCDLNRQVREAYGIEYIPGHMTYPGGTESATFLDWSECKFYENCSAETFYGELKKDPDGFTTSPPNIQEISDAFEKYVREGKGVLSMTISSTMSGTYSFAVAARNNVLEKYPDAEISVIDTRRFGPGYGLMAVHASLLRAEGRTLAEVTEYLEANKNRFHQMGWLDDLSFVAKKGRITHAKAFFGTLVGVKPIGEFDSNGMTTVLGKAKGEKSAYKVMLDYIAKTVEEPEKQVFFIAHTNRRRQALLFKDMLEEQFHPKEIYLNDVFPACGINVGPGLMAAYYMGKPISGDLAEERGIIEASLKNS